MDSVQPLRISKSASSASSNSSPSRPAMASPRPLAEIGNTERRRNSPSYNQATKKMIVSSESSPYIENSFSFTQEPDPSPRGFWRTKDPMSPARYDDAENTPDRSPSPVLLSSNRRASIEKLKQAGRVKTSSIFALESKDAYDPNNMPIIERPSSNRPLSQHVANNTFTRFDSLRKENNPYRSPGRLGHKRTESVTTLPVQTTPTSASKYAYPSNLRREGAPSPTKSSMARTSQFESPSETAPSSYWSEGDDRAPTPRALHRHNKSVTFNEAPPELNEYEHPTPEPSVSAASGSREGSWESDEYDPEYSFERGSSSDLQNDDSFDEDLENADKTPVVLPEDWSRMSPDEARTDLVDEGDNVFEGSPNFGPAHTTRSMSAASDGDSRPLPPLPGMMTRSRIDGSAAAADHASQAAPKRLADSTTESPNACDPSHGMAEEITITNLDTGERMDVNVDETEVEDDSVIANLTDFANSPPKISRESILRKVRNSKYDLDDEDDNSEVISDEITGRPSYAELAKMHPDDPVPSRENSRETSDKFVGDQEATVEVKIKDEPFDDENIDMANIPSFENQTFEQDRSPSRMDDYERQSSVLRHDIDYYSDEDDVSGSRYSSVDPEAESTVLHAQQQQDEAAIDGKETLQEAMELLTVKDYSSRGDEALAIRSSGDFVGLPAYLSTDDFGSSFEKYTTPPPQPPSDSSQRSDLIEKAPVLQPPTMKDLPRPTYDGAEFSPPGTPDSVIHHSNSEVSALEEPHAFGDSVEPDSPAIPERRATIRTNGKLKARPSATPADLLMMAEQRRLVSAEHPVPPIPQAYQAEIDEVTENEIEGNESTTETLEQEAVEQSIGEGEENRKDAKLNLDIPSLSVDNDGDGLDLDQAFDRVIESQKVGHPFPIPPFARFDPAEQQAHFLNVPPFGHAERFQVAEQSNPVSPWNKFSHTNVSPPKQKGYLMRQNTKVVVASSRDFSDPSKPTASTNSSSGTGGSSNVHSQKGSLRSGHNSSRKPSEEQHLKTEPWNGKYRRESQRQTSAANLLSGPAPPLPGQPSALGVVNEDFAAGTGSLDDEVAEGVERGRLFVKVVCVKDLDLPMPRNERLSFQLTLDNGLHCVTTSSLELGKKAPIGQEFELVVLNDLEFQLTLHTKLRPPPPAKAAASTSPTKTAKHGKSSSISRFLTSPKKRAEKERQEREAMEAEERRAKEEANRKRASTQATAWDLLHELVNNSDGSFARSYVNLKVHERQCFGRQLTVDVPCYNEWALENDSAVVNSVRSKRGNAGPIRKPPYVVGKLELQLLYVPKPAGASDDEMPKSMSSAVREMNKASDTKEIVHEDHLSQQGGDCIHWRRRFFRLQGPRLTAYHEHTHQKRAVINLSKAQRLVDDKSTLVADPRSGNPGSKTGRRKSAFAEEDEGYQYVEEGFRIRFANGETIDFYADSRQQKESWMDVLSQVIGKPDPGKKGNTWTDLVLARERAEGVNVPGVPATTDVHDFTKSSAPARNASDRKPVSKGVPTSPVKNAAAPPDRNAPAPPTADEVVRPQTPPMNPRRGHRSRDAVKSMIF